MPAMTGARFIAESLGAYGVTHVFFVPAIMSHTLAAMECRAGRTGTPARPHRGRGGRLGGQGGEGGARGVTAGGRFARVPPFRPRPEPEAVAAAARLLEAAARPILVAGGGARTSGAGPEL